MIDKISRETSNKIANMSFVCAVLVVFIHLCNIPTNVGTISWMVWYTIRYSIATIAVPFFFVVSGFFLARHIEEKGWWRGAIESRMRTLVVPYICWCLINFLIIVVFTRMYSYFVKGNEEVFDISFWWLMGVFGVNPLAGPYVNGPLWYVRALCIFIVLSPIIVYVVKRFRAKALLIMYCIYLVLNPGHVDIEFWVSERLRTFLRFGFSVEGCFYFMTGIYLACNKLGLARNNGILLGLFGLLIGLIRMVIKANGYCDGGYLVPLAIPFVIAGVWSIMPSKRFLSAMVNNSFTLYVSHTLLIFSINVIDKHIGLLSHNENIGIALLEWTLAVASSLICCIGIKRFMPKVASFIFGGR